MINREIDNDNFIDILNTRFLKQDEQKDPRNGGVISLFLEALKKEEEEGGRRLFPPMQSSHCSRGISSTSRSRIILRPPPSSITIFLPAIKGCTYQHSIPVPCVQWKIYPPRRISILSLPLFARETWPKILTRRDQEEEEEEEESDGRGRGSPLRRRRQKNRGKRFDSPW